MVSAKTFSEITPVWLTAILTERGGLLAGRVLRVEQTRDPNPITQNVTLLLTYSPDASWARAGPRSAAARTSGAWRSSSLLLSQYRSPSPLQLTVAKPPQKQIGLCLSPREE